MGSVVGERDYVLTARLQLPGERAAFYRAAAHGRFVRIRPGVFLPSGLWDELDSEDRHIAQARGTALVDPSAVFSHLTAAMLWRLPLTGPVPDVPQVTVRRAAGGRSSQSVARFAVGEPGEVVELDRLRVVSLRETVLGVAAAFDATVSVPMLDAALAGRTRDAHAVTLDELRRPRPVAHRRVGFALDLADGRSGSAGESLSRLTIHRAGLPAPQLQVPFSDDRGLIGIVDFWWPEAGLIGEFDGLGKYRRDLSGRGRAPADIVIAEKRREDRLRSLGPRVVRWGWSAARSVFDLHAILTRAGLRATQLHSRR